MGLKEMFIGGGFKSLITKIQIVDNGQAVTIKHVME